MTHGGTPAYIQEYFWFRTDGSNGLNADSGWLGAENSNQTLDAGTLYRVRFKVRETASEAGSTTFKLQNNHASAGWVDCTEYNNATQPSAVIIWRSPNFADGDAVNLSTLEKLTSTTGNVNGEGRETNTTGTIALNNQETEIEFCFIIMRTYAITPTSPGLVDDADTIELRLVEGDGTVFAGTYTNPTITVNMPTSPSYLGGTVPETYGPTLIQDGNDNLYCVMENDVDFNRMVLNKSADGGQSWSIVDDANRPTQGDLEMVGMALSDAGDDLHFIYTTSNVEYGIFRVSTHATNPDTYELTDENAVSSPADGSSDQAASLAILSDDSVFAVYNDSDGTNNRCKFVERNGSWSGSTTIDSTASVDIEDCWVIKEAGSDKLHFFYRDETNLDLYHNSKASGAGLGTRESFETDALGNRWTCYPVAWTSGSDEKVLIAYVDASDGLLYSVQITNDGSPETRKQISTTTVHMMTTAGNENDTGGRYPVAALAVDNVGTVFCFFARASDGNIYRTELGDGDSAWSSDTLFETAIDDTHQLVCQYFTYSSTNYIGVVLTREVGNYTGRTYFDRYEIPAPAGGDVLQRGLSSIEAGVVASGAGSYSGLHSIESGYIA